MSSKGLENSQGEKLAYEMRHGLLQNMHVYSRTAYR